ncbi:unnamed protein product [Medioppia subpectinata]|uniref:60S ribosomal protein L21 n=1 Tax=Medioppia subpectinata TaxID=1979941 RepID=A0A7R9KHC0_9ACAR|nr:unnamed protein product [Medioppia subpectinata]CAG2103407.1 unnamed protein product [Medioppia subpectinata]
MTTFQSIVNLEFIFCKPSRMRSNGYRRGTRTLFRKDFKKRGMPNPTKVLQPFKMGDLVDCKVDPSIVKGMPHKYYHGQTGKGISISRGQFMQELSICIFRRVIWIPKEDMQNIRREFLRLEKQVIR